MIPVQHVASSQTATPQWSLVASVLLVVATPVAAWCLVGDLSEPVAQPDYIVHPIAISHAVERGLGFGSALIVLASVSVLVSELWRHRLDRKWLPPIVFLVVAGVITGSGWRVVTAGVIGANIGGGPVLGFGAPLVVVLVVAAIASSFLGSVRRGQS